jgi:hypothetical protein
VTVGAAVYDPTNTTLVANLYATSGGKSYGIVDGTFSRPLVGAGSGGISVVSTHPSVAQLTTGRVVRLSSSDGVEQCFTIDDKPDEPVRAEGRDLVVRVSGDGLLSRWREALVAPWIEVTDFPKSSVRLFNWSSPGLDVSGWSDTVYAHTRSTSNPQRPIAWLDEIAQWIGPAAENPSMTSGYWYLDAEFTLGSDTQIVFPASADDEMVTALDGVTLIDERPEFPAQVWWYTHRAGVLVPAGTHTYRARIGNVVGPTAFIGAAWESDGTTSGDPVWLTNADPLEDFSLDWKCLAFPSSAPGFTAGAIIRILLEEAQDRGELTGWTLSFDDDEDTDGNPWPIIPEFSCKVGESLYQVLDKLSGTWIDCAAGDSGLVMNAWDKSAGRGTATAVALDSELTTIKKSTQRATCNAALCTYRDGQRWVLNSASITARGRIAKELPLGSMSDTDSVDEIGQQFVDAYGVDAVSYTAGIVAGTVTNLDIGDTFDLGTLEGVRLVGRSGRVQADDLAVSLEVSSPLQERRLRVERVIDRAVAAAGEGAQAAAPPVDTGSGIPVGRVATKQLGSAWSIYRKEDLEDTDPLAPLVIEEPTRLYEWKVTGDNSEADGDTVVELWLNGSILGGLPFEITLGSTDDEGSQFIFGPALAVKGDKLQPVVTAAGGHKNVSIQVYGADPV